MTGIDLSAAIEAESKNTEAATTTDSPTDSEESEIPFERNESTEGYALFADSSSLVAAISTEVFDNDPVYSLLEWGMTLEDYPDIIEENNLSDQQKLDVLHKLAKGTFGGRQSELNEGYGMGWNTDGEGPPTVYDNDKVDHVPYLDVYSELSAFDHDTLEGGEIAQLEEEGLDIDDFGFDDSIEGPQLPKVNGERVPILAEGNGEVMTFLEMMNSIDFEEVTYCLKDGELQGTPTLGPSEGEAEESDTDKGGDSDEVSLAENPEAIGSFTVNEVKKEVTDISSRRTLRQLLNAEENGKDRSVTKRIQQRIRAVSGDDEVDSEESEETSEEDVSEAVEDVDTEGLSDAQMNLASTLLETGEAENLQEAKEMVSR